VRTISDFLPSGRNEQRLADGRIGKHEQAVPFNCATGLKCPLPHVERRLDLNQEIDFAALA